MFHKKSNGITHHTQAQTLQHGLNIFSLSHATMWEVVPVLLCKTMQIVPSYFPPGAAVTFYSGNAFKPFLKSSIFPSPSHPLPSTFPHS